ncbi:hypothetical protein ACPRNU_01040 [Chromobacterium vaccinii]|uniref:hypothetical protein n=1 Tax=Chromobacterium vaccinii TaxID=1108595 RepID=UPI003C7801FC
MKLLDRFLNAIKSKNKITPDYITDPMSLEDYLRSIIGLAADVSVITGVMTYVANRPKCPPVLTYILAAALLLTPGFLYALSSNDFYKMVTLGKTKTSKFIRFTTGSAFLFFIAMVPLVSAFSTVYK